MTTHDLLFLNPVQREGLNVTVRHGTKWHDQASPGDALVIKRTGDEDTQVARGRVLFCELVLFEDIPKFWLLFEHDPGCQTPDGLRKAMDRAYGEGNWGHYVSILFHVV